MKLTFNDTNLKEIFALFTVQTKYEYNQVFDKNSIHCLDKENLDEEYELTSEKREFAYDSIKAVLLFLRNHGYEIYKDRKLIDLDDFYGSLPE